MSKEWFYMQQWQQKSWEALLEHRTVRVSWDTDNGEQVETLPQFVKIPAEVELTNKSISQYLSDTFGWCVLDWNVARRQNES